MFYVGCFHKMYIFTVDPQNLHSHTHNECLAIEKFWFVVAAKRVFGAIFNILEFDMSAIPSATSSRAWILMYKWIMHINFPLLAVGKGYSTKLEKKNRAHTRLKCPKSFGFTSI